VAVLVEGISVIVRVDAINNKYPGGWGAFRDAAPNSTLCCDNELARIGFMSPADTKAFVYELEKLGLVYIEAGVARDIAVADQQRGFPIPCKWAEFGRIDFDGDPRKQVASCRLLGSSERLFTPDGWSFDKSLSSQFLFVGSGWVPEFMDFIRHENGLDVYRDLRTGKDVYVGRTDA
jgi:hypothetical protein